MVCEPCAEAADKGPGGHSAEICRDNAIQPHGCPCGHRPSAPKEATS